MIQLWYCDITRRTDSVTEQELSHAVSTRHCPSHAIGKAKSGCGLLFRQEDTSQNMVETSLGPWLLESDYYANNVY